MAREWTDPRGAGSRDIDSHHEIGLSILREPATALVHGLLKTDRRAPGQERRFDWDELARLNRLAHGNHIGLCYLTEISFVDPNSNPRVVLGEQNSRVEANGLEGGGEKECGIEAGGEPLTGDARRPPNLLALALK